jgi:MFS family permease
MSDMSQPTGQAPGRFRRLVGKFTCLRTAPRELWLIYAAYIMENLAYKVGAAMVLTLWLSADLGFGDESAGGMIAVWSAIMTLITVLIGPLTDALGIRKTFLMGFWISLVSRIVMTLSVEPWIVMTFGLYLQAVGMALLVPVMIAAVKKYTNAAQRSVAFSLYYALMNLGYAAGDWIFDRVRSTQHGMGEHGTWILPGLDMELSTYRVLIMLGAILTVPGLLMTQWFLRDGVEMTETGIVIAPRKSAVAGSLLGTAWASCRSTAVKTWEIFSSLWGQPSFYRFLTFMSLVVGVKMIFYHLSYTFPKYGLRELGDGAPIAQLSGMLNSVLIVFLVPIVGVLTSKVTAYRMVTVGSLISALSVFFIAMPPDWFQPLADGWLGDMVGRRWLGIEGVVHPLYVSNFLFIVFLSVGEAVWSPRLYEYSAAIAPEGQEASYMALSLLPYFVAKFVVGGMSGWLLATFCPAEGARSSETMWLIIGCMALVTPVGAFLFRKHIQVREAGRDVDPV